MLSKRMEPATGKVINNAIPPLVLMTEEKEWNIPCFCAYTAPLTTTVSYFQIRAAKQGMDLKQTPWLSSQWEGKLVLAWSLDLTAPSHTGGLC